MMVKRWNIKYNNELWYDTTSYHSVAVFDRKAMYSKDFYDALYQFFLEYQPDLSVVYDDLGPLIERSASDDEIIDLIRERYPEIYNYKGTNVELQKEVDRLKQELAEQKAEVDQLTRRFENLQGNVTQTSVGTAVRDDSVKLYADDGGAWQGYGTFETTALPYIRPEIYNGVLSGLKVQADKQDDGKTKWTFTTGTSEPKPSPEPTEVVYVLRIQPDTMLHAAIIKFVDKWSYADELIGIEKHYVFE